MKKISALLWAALLVPASLIPAALVSTPAQAQVSAASDLTMNGIASFEQLRKEYYLGALLLEFPSRDPNTVVDARGRKRMAMHITADRWPPMRFAQQWNQAILINSDSATLNANVMDVLAFTSLPKEDLIAGDQLYVDLDVNGHTEVSLNGQVLMRTGNDALFRLIVNSWIGPRPPSSEFKNALLLLAPQQQSALLERFEATAPSQERRRTVASWGGRSEPAIAAAPTAAPAAEVRARPEPVPSPAPARPEPPAAPPAVAATAPPAKVDERPAPPAADTARPVAAAIPPPPTPAAAPAPPAAEPAPEPAASQQVAVSAPAATAVVDDAAEQKRLYDSYSGDLRKLVYSKLRYPRRAVDKNIEGLVVIRVETDRNGQLLAVNPAQSSHRLLDNAAVDAVEQAAPFPQIAARLKGENFSFMIPVVFKLAE